MLKLQYLNFTKVVNVCFLQYHLTIFKLENCIPEGDVKITISKPHESYKYVFLQ